MHGDYYRHIREVAERERQIADTAYQQGFSEGLGASSNYQAGYQAGLLEARRVSQRRELWLWAAVLLLGLFLFLGVGSLTQLITAVFHPVQCEAQDGR